MSTDDRFTEIVERHEAATKGPYEWIEAAVMADGYTYVNDLDSPHAGDDPVASGRVAGEGADLEALAHSWADRAWLIAEVRRLRKELNAATAPVMGNTQRPDPNEDWAYSERCSMCRPLDWWKVCPDTEHPKCPRLVPTLTDATEGRR